MKLVVLLALIGACEKARDGEPPPSPAPTPVAPDAGTLQTSCDAIVLQVTPQGTWIGVPPHVRCFAARGDADALETELRRIQVLLAECNSRVAEVAATPGVAYQDVITVMDAAVKLGRRDVGLSDPAQLSMQFGTPPATSTPCTGVVAVPSSRRDPRPLRPAPGDAIQSTMIVISRDSITINGKPVADVADVVSGSGAIAALAAALPKPVGGRAILQADLRVDANVINRVMLTAKAAGYDNLAFAVTNP